MLMSKVDQVDLEAVINMKSNKADTDVAMKGLDIVHKQVTHMIVLVVELIKSCMNSLSVHNDSDKTKHHKNLMYILQQAVNVCRWINDFDPQNVNIEDLVLPNELRNLNDHSKSLVLDFPKLDKVAEVALRKYRVRGGLQIATIIPSDHKDDSPMRNSLMSPQNQVVDKDMMPITQQLDKYITSTLVASSRKQRNLGKLFSSRHQVFAHKATHAKGGGFFSSTQNPS